MRPRTDRHVKQMPSSSAIPSLKRNCEWTRAVTEPGAPAISLTAGRMRLPHIHDVGRNVAELEYLTAYSIRLHVRMMCVVEGTVCEGPACAGSAGLCSHGRRRIWSRWGWLLRGRDGSLLVRTSTECYTERWIANIYTDTPTLCDVSTAVNASQEL